MCIDFFKPLTRILCFLWVGVFYQTANAQFQQKGQQISPFSTDQLYLDSEFGTALSLSNDGNTAIIGAPYDVVDIGAALIYTLTPCGWEVAAKLVGTGGVQGTMQGYSVDISADGTVAVIGAPKDNNWVGAAWVFVKSGGTWAQVKKLTPADASGEAQFGSSVAIAGDGNTIIIGGEGDNDALGAAWVFRYSANQWAQDGAKLVGSSIIHSTNPNFYARQGRSVDISADGTTVIVGASGHQAGRGAAIIYTRSGNWSETYMLFGNTGNRLGYAVALSGDGLTALIGTPGYDNRIGGFVVMVNGATGWQQQGGYEQGTGGVGKAQQGCAVSLSADGNRAVIGGNGNSIAADNVGVGQSWVFTRAGSIWSQTGGKYIGIPSQGNCQQGSAVALSGNGTSFLTAGYANEDYYGAAWYFTTEPMTIPAPSISDFNPKTATDPQTVTITGLNFHCVKEVSFGNVFGDILSQTTTTIIARVNGNASDSSGDVCVYAAGGMDCMAGFTYGQDTSTTSIVPIASAESLIQLYPNPAQTSIHIKLPQPDVSAERIIIRDGMGRKVLEYPLLANEADIVLNISALPVGIYMVEVSPSLRVRWMKE